MNVRDYLRWLPIALLVPGLFLQAPATEGSRWWSAVWNFGHVVLFALIAFNLAHWRLQRAPARWSFVVAMLGVLALVGGAIEIVQAMTGRDGEWQDVLDDVIGAVVALCFSRYGVSLLAGFLRRLVVWFTGVLLLLWSAQDVLIQSWDLCFRWYAFPVLYSADAQFATRARLTLDNVAVEVVESQSVAASPQVSASQSTSQPQVFDPSRNEPQALLKVSFHPGEYSTLTLSQVNADWRGYRQLVWRWYNPGSPSVLLCRVHDRQHEKNGFDYRDRFSERYALQEGWNDIVIPLSAIQKAPATREMDLSHMQSLACFESDLTQDHSLYLQKVELK